MAFFRQYIAPLFIFAIFFVALAAVSARIFLPSDMAMPAVMDEPGPSVQSPSQPTAQPTVQTALPGLLPGAFSASAQVFRLHVP
jgi:hypothetical protein